MAATLLTIPMVRLAASMAAIRLTTLMVRLAPIMAATLLTIPMAQRAEAMGAALVANQVRSMTGLSLIPDNSKGKTMAKQATDAEVMEYLWPTEERVHVGQAMTDPKITSVGIAAALLLFSALLFGERAEAQYVMGIDCLNGAREIRSMTAPSATSIEPSEHLEEPES